MDEMVEVWATPLLDVSGLDLELGGWIGIMASRGGICRWIFFLVSTVGRKMNTMCKNEVQMLHLKQDFQCNATILGSSKNLSVNTS